MQQQGLISVEKIYKAKVRLKQVAVKTPLLYNPFYSQKYDCKVYFKREDLQVVRSYKIRGAYNKMASLPKAELQNGIVCASAGNHAQGVAFACQKLAVKGKIYMPSTTPKQKINKVNSFGGSFVEIILTGDTFDDSFAKALQDAEENDLTFIHPFNDEKVIEGQGTVGLEILEDCEDDIDYIFVAIGGGGIISGLGSYFKQMSPETKVIGVEPAGAAGMSKSIKAGKVVQLEEMDVFVDGAAVRRVGNLNFRLCQQVVDDYVIVPEGKVCTTILELYNEEAIVVEPAGALSLSALDFYREKIKGKTIVCLIGGGNNDITRMEDIKERSLLYEGIKHYFIIRFPQRAGALRQFLNDVLGPNDDITHFEYSKKNNKNAGPALVGLELKSRADYEQLIRNMQKYNIDYQTINNQKMLFNFLV
ncbi:MAG: threonine ammonia-lyase IlvA [Bacteroidota bacterium]